MISQKGANSSDIMTKKPIKSTKRRTFEDSTDSSMAGRKSSAVTNLIGVNNAEDSSASNSNTATGSFREINPAIKLIRSNIIGDRYIISTPFGSREIVYADYTASGRSLKFVEDYMVKVVSPTYANTHTEASATGAQTTHLREESRGFIRTVLNAPKKDYAVLFTGTGSTAAIEKLFHCLGLGIPEYIKKRWNLDEHIPEDERPVVFLSHFEHHSNELFWRESIAKTVIIKEGKDGAPDLAHLESELLNYKGKQIPMIGSFSAGSNVTGIKAPVKSICSLLHAHGAYAFIDYAGVGSYVKIDMQGSEDWDAGDSSIDAAFFSPHKFVGGPGSAGLLVARKKLFQNAFGIETNTATSPGGGTIAYVARDSHAYSTDIEHREDSGTPGILQSIRTGLAFKVKEMVGCETIDNLERLNCALALTSWRSNPSISLMGSDRVSFQFASRRVSIFSFNLLSPVSKIPHSPISTERYVGFERTYSDLLSESINRFSRVGTVDYRVDFIPLHYNFTIALLNDVYGIQGRGGCSCAGPYGLDMFNISQSHIHKDQLNHIYNLFKCAPGAKPGWARVNLNYFISRHEVAFIIEAVNQIAKDGWKLLPHYIQDWHSGQFYHHSLFDGDRTKNPNPTLDSLFSIDDIKIAINTTNGSKSVRATFPKPQCLSGQRTRSHYRQVLNDANKLYAQQTKKANLINRRKVLDFTTKLHPTIAEDDIWWLRPSQAEQFLLSQSPITRDMNKTRIKSSLFARQRAPC